MAANSLLLFLLTTGVTTPPEQSVTTESNFEANTLYTREDAAQWHAQTRWPGFGQEPEHISVRWRQEPRYSTEKPYDRYSDPPATEVSDDKTDPPYNWPRATDESEEERQRPTINTLATEEPESETVRAQVRQTRKCPSREHFTKCHKNCEKTCDNYHKRNPCPRSCKKGCVCDGGLVRNKEGKCVSRYQCPKANTIYTREDAAQWHAQTRWPGFDQEPEDISVSWRQEPRYSTERPYDRYSDPPATEDANTIYTREDAAQWHAQTRWPGFGQEPEDISVSWRQEPRYSTERPYDRYSDPPATEVSDDKTDRPYNWPRATDESEEERQRPTINTLATEEPESETVRAQVWQTKKCPSREHFTKCHKNCEKTCDNYRKRKPCPRSCKKGCVCDGGLVRNKKGECVPRDQCTKKMMAEKDDDSHGCPYKYACDVYCIEQGQMGGECVGKVCKCQGR